ncbi:hypothetical protein K469DRAFT_333946 [Zopfia rhizophila CBS 207.26]|uniref:Uncharacterized protein n=1 Tax=Zopfia rhizophila CBS 207.26 TaxID=1314779 RepID=A0A6A6DFE6_9PEZI|nr:hypothetical protein K469DRAFT_333946 [Zopfia rhizophila CBS 207.26]
MDPKYANQLPLSSSYTSPSPINTWLRCTKLLRNGILGCMPSDAGPSNVGYFSPINSRRSVLFFVYLRFLYL